MVLKIISMVKMNGQWVNQEEIPPQKMQEILEKTMLRAGNNIGAQVQKTA